MKKLFSNTPPGARFYLPTLALGLSILLILVTFQQKTTSYAVAVEPRAQLLEGQQPKLEEQQIEDDSSDRELIGCDCEKTFEKPIPIVWTGTVIATFVSGEDIGIRNSNKNAKYKQAYVNAAGQWNRGMGHNVRIKGNLIGITCAYANTIFGECVADVDAEKITPI